MDKQHFRSGIVGSFAAAALLLGTAGDAGAWGAAVAVETAPVPPAVEQPAVASAGGLYCYNGPHPVDTRVAAGAPWDETQGAHSHTYPPFDLRLYSFKDGCYYFIGDPKDFGYTGPTYSYYGAHPVLDHYGGGWCFMVGGHAHWWRPWSPYFVVAGPWFYWHGPYDPFFWSYWPYYATYYHHYYPRYYGRGSWRRGGVHGGRGWTAAPPIGRVAAPPARAMTGSPAPATGGAATGRGAAPSPARPTWGAVPRNDGWASNAQGWSNPAPARGTYQAVPRRADGPVFRSAPVNPGFRSAPGPTFRSAPPPAPAPSYRSTPMRSDTGFRSAPSSGGFRGGGARSSGGGTWRGR